MPQENDEAFSRPSQDEAGTASPAPFLLPDLLRRLGLDREQEDTLDLLGLLADLRSTAWYRRAAAVRALAKLGERAPLAPLLAALDDPHVSVRANAVLALSQLGTYAPVERLAEILLRDSEWQVRESAADALRTLGTRAPVAPLLAALHDPDTIVRQAAQRALSQLRPALPNPGQSTAEAPAPPVPSQEQVGLQPVSPYVNRTNTYFYEKEESMPDNDFSTETVPFTRGQSYVPEAPRRRRSKTWRVVSLSIAVAVVIINLLAWSILTHALRGGSATGSRLTSGPTPTTMVTLSPTPAVSPGKTLFVYPPPGAFNPNDFMSVGWSSDGKTIALSELAVTLFNATNGHVLRTFAQQSNSIWVSWEPHGTRLAVSGQTVQVWDTKTNQLLSTYTPSSASAVQQTQRGGGPLLHLSGGNLIYNSSWSPDGQLIASAVDGNAYGYNVQIWNSRTGVHVRTLQIKANASANDYISQVGWSHDGKYIAASSMNNSVSVWNAATGQHIYTKQGATVMAWAPGNDLLATADGNDNLVQVWQPGGTVQFSFQNQSGATINALAWSPNGQYIAIGSSDVRIWDVAQHKQFYVYTGHGTRKNLYINSLAWSPDSTEIVSMGSGIDVTSPHTGIALDSIRVWIAA
ncbi:MAG TPA: HEAT repeat domain-containing protein [Ktedonobacteraceae bacterium]